MTDEAIVRAAFPQLTRLPDEWAHDVVQIWLGMWQESSWAELSSCPYNPIAPSVSLVVHVAQVTEGALQLGVTTARWLGVAVDEHVVIAAGLLHDASKLVEYEPSPDGTAQKSAFGLEHRHAVYAAARARKRNLPAEVVAIILNHTVQAPEVPSTLEALCVYYADMCAADQARLLDGSPLAAAAHKRIA